MKICSLKRILNLGIFISLWIFLFAPISNANPAPPIRLERPALNINDRQSLQRGAKFFASQCMVCHSLKYLQYNSIAEQAGITIEKMPKKDQLWWFGKTPPDLSLIARARGVNWLYTYLHSFYKDPTTTLGSNNLLVENTSMPNPFLGIQGIQELNVDKKTLLRLSQSMRKPHWYNLLKLVKQGSIPSQEFDETIADLVNFLAYASEPVKSTRQQIGWWVVIFLIIFMALTYLLKKEYWKKIH